MASPRGQSHGLRILRKGYILPFLIQPNLTRSAPIIIGYVHPLRNSYPTEVLHACMQKNAVELVRTQKSLGFFNRLFLVPKPNWWRPVMDLGTMNKFLKAEKFKMATPETIRTSLQPGEWVTYYWWENYRTTHAGESF